MTKTSDFLLSVILIAIPKGFKEKYFDYVHLKYKTTISNRTLLDLQHKNRFESLKILAMYP